MRPENRLTVFLIERLIHHSRRVNCCKDLNYFSKHENAALIFKRLHATSRV